MDLRIPEEDMKPLHDMAYNRLKEAILAGHFAPGERLSERKLAEEMGISTSPIKHALSRLGYEGLAEIRPRKGTYVSEFSMTTAQEIVIVRGYLEGLAARFAAEKATEQDLEELDRQIKEMERLTQSGSTDELVNANSEFHAMVQRASKNPYIHQLITVIRDIDHSIRKRALVHADEARRGLIEHRAVLEAIRQRDGGLAEERMRTHITRTGKFVMGER